MRFGLKLLVPALLLCAGCPGTMTIWGLNGMGGDDDDSSDDLVLDFGQYEGVEYLNIDWAEEQEALGATDCVEGGAWAVSGEETTTDDQNLCTACTHIWRITLEPDDEVAECLDGTGITAQVLVRRTGIVVLNEQDFTVWRNTGSENANLNQVGVGAFSGADFTWSGRDGFQSEASDQRFYYYFSGEGAF